jgi:hypothetical protein
MNIFYEWEKNQDDVENEMIDSSKQIGFATYIEKIPDKPKPTKRIVPWTDFNYIHLGSNKSGYSGVNN